MSIRSFGKAIDESVDYEEARQPLMVLTIAGRDVQFYEPTAGQASYFALALASVEQGEGLVGTGRLINLIGNCMGEDDQAFWTRTLVDPRSGLEIDDFIDIATMLVTESAANPTTEPSGSSPSRQAGGQRSTAGSRRAPSSRSGSRSTAS